MMRMTGERASGQREQQKLRVRGTQQMDFGGNECTHTRTDRGGDLADDDDEKAPGQMDAN